MRNRYSSILFSVILAFCSQIAWAQQLIKGKVTDEKQQPLPGVTVLLKGTSTGTATDVDGNYSLQVPGSDGTLVFSFIGYTTKEAPISGRSTVNVALADDAKALGEVVVTALGISKEQRALGYATSTVSAKELTEAGNTNFASALYGKAAGVKITTAPGGATSGVNVQIRGINSLNFNSQPLYVVDGVLIRNNNERGASGANNGGYWDDQRIRGNGILDINPSDIETLTVLKGASATALYGSDAASGVIVITTKKGSQREGLGIDVNYTYNIENVAFTPNYQNIYGPGYDRATNLAVGATEEGWIPVDLDGDGVEESLRPNFRAYGQFGPKMEGQIVPWWDGTMRAYSPQPDNYKDFYQTGYSSIINAALSNQTDKASYRLSYTRNDYEGVQRGGEMNRNTFNLNSTFKINNRLSADIVANYVNTYVKNRPMQINRLTASFDGFLGRSEDMSVWLNNYQTSEGYKYVLPTQTDRNPEEALAYNIRPEVLNFLWNQLRNSEEEYEDRLITSATINYEIAKGLRLRGRVGNDFTSRAIETRQYNEYPIAFNENNSTGYFGTSKGRYATFYGDALLSYTNNITDDLEFTVNGGFQGRKESYRDQSSGTRDGLTTANWFSINNSFNLATTSASRAEVTKYAYLGTLSFNYKDYLYIEGTGRQEYTSTLPAANNNYFYPSINAGFVFTDAFMLPTFLSYGKIRASYGVVGNAPSYYSANVTYSQTPLQTINGPVPSLSAQATYGNESLVSENKYESEFGLETKILNNKIGLDLSYYDSRVKDQILYLSLPTSTGATSRLSNVGEIRSHGWELALNATPVSGTINWDTRLNFAFNRSKVHSLNEGLEELVFYDAEQSSVRLVARVGETIGDIYVFPRATDAAGNYIINSDGLYVIDKTRYEKAGNILPKVVGGISNTLSYKNLSLDFLVDYRLGGQIISTPLKYATGAGMFENTLQYRDEANGGLPYYIDASDNKVLLPNHSATAPNGGTVYHDGVLLDGVTEEGQQNSTIVDAATYYMNTFAWGADSWNSKGSVFDNSFVKMREVVLGYNLPKAVAQKFKFQNLRVSLVGRNLFYFWRTLENLDPEAPIGTQWYRQGIDEGSSAATRSYGFQINASF
ncbi:SusC/RagA family TonB-linked outer membrane protein [Pontibacter silvestris]|uniref:SusC/RagA family TonB-linked outer membrane protein n=1 Tax=Pontibacter silvestris TaxID=2305183 RepID=A0ABW4WT47_9BACT|nr:SusC/RagA family TonB-linked outer membrane protein [Pontibacter silvestris]MCC9137869.1 SusC/RagA family TonB-linked outer membrane protein [Pontibacter silvestris]